MVISIFGLGYVGCVSLGCLAKDGNKVIGVDIESNKVDLVNKGLPTIIESEIAEIISEKHSEGMISATTDYRTAVMQSDVSMVCVGTPTTEQGHLDMKSIFAVARQIGEVLGEKESFHTIVIRSTVQPGTNAKVGQIIAEISGKKSNEAFGVVSNPEFMREGSAVEDYYNPGIVLLGSDCERSLNIVKQIYKHIDVPIEITDIGVTEIIKYLNNTFHALKVVFANEVGNICKKAGIDSHKVFDIFCRDKKLNISAKYLRPGFAYGGSCLPKDLSALTTLAHDYYLKCPVISAIEESNSIQKDIAFNMVLATDKRKIGVIGLSFKPGTDDLRYSPSVNLVERLLGKGYAIKIYDKHVFCSKLTGTNKAYIDKHIPHLKELITDNLEAVIDDSDVLVVTHDYDELSRFGEKISHKSVVDLVRIKEVVSGHNYEGICW